MGVRPPAGRGENLDIVFNVCFYAPLGALGVLAWWRGSGTPGRWLALAAFGAALSCTLEAIQAWVPTRDSSVLDILTNTIGTIVGARVGLMLAGTCRRDQAGALRWIDVADAFVAALLVGRLLRELPTRRAARWAVAGARGRAQALTASVKYVYYHCTGRWAWTEDVMPVCEVGTKSAGMSANDAGDEITWWGLRHPRTWLCTWWA